MERIGNSGVTLNLDKCQFSKTSVRFLGQVIDAQGIRPDPDKLEAIKNMRQQENVKEVRRFLGMINQMSKFAPHLSEISKPLRDLLSLKYQWTWSDAQEEAFQRIKEDLVSSKVLVLYDHMKEIKVSADASSYGLGAVLEQRSTNGTWRPVAYTSRSMSDTEQRYAQIEREALAVT